jgi:hypothetical protein
MFRIRLPNGVEMMFPSVEDFQAAVQSGVVTSDAEIFHQKAERWVPIASHPTYHRAVAAARAAVAAQTGVPVPAPARRVVPTAAAPAGSGVRAAEAPAAPEIPQTAPRQSVPATNVSAQRLKLVAEATNGAAPPLPAIQRPAVPAPAPVAPPAVHSAPVLKVSLPPAPTPPPPPAGPELKFVNSGQAPAVSAPAPLKVSAPSLGIKPPIAPPVVDEPGSPTLPDLTDDFEILEGFMPADSAVTVELSVAGPPAPRPEPAHQREAASHQPQPRVSHPAPAHAEAPPTPAAAPAHPHTQPHAHAPAHAPAPARAKSGSGRWLIAAGLGAALIGGGALVAWRSTGARAPVAPVAPNAVTSAYTPVPRTEIPAANPSPTASAPAPSATTPPPASQVVTKPAPPVTAPSAATTPPPAPATKPAAPAVDSSNVILPGRPQSMAVDIDVSGADVGTAVGAAGPSGAAAGLSLGVVADHYAAAAADAGKQLEARLTQIGYSRLLAPLRFGSVEAMEGARHTVSSAAGMVAAYRSRMQALEKIYGDSAAHAQQGQKATPKDMLAWDRRLPQRETPEAAQAVDLALTKVDQLYAALLAHPLSVKADANNVTISDPDLDKQYQSLRQWLAQRFDSWSGSPADVVPPTVRQTMKAFSDAILH